MESNPDVLAFTSYKVDPKIIERIKNDPQLNDIKNYLNKNPSLISYQVNLYQADNKNIAYDKSDFNNIISKIREQYNNNLLIEMINREKKVDKIQDPSIEEEMANEEKGIQLITRKGGKTKRKKRVRKRSKFNNRLTPRYKKKTLRNKRKK
jgi:hypothetical protein